MFDCIPFPSSTHTTGMTHFLDHILSYPFGSIFYRCICGHMFCMLLFNFVNYEFLLLCLCILIITFIYILIVTYVPFCVFSFILLLCVLFVCKCVLYYCLQVSTRLRIIKYISTYKICRNNAIGCTLLCFLKITIICEE